MNLNPQRDIKSLARAYWQPLLLAILSLLIFLQTYSWAVKFVDLHKVDTILAQAEQINTVKKENKSNPNTKEMPNTNPAMSNNGMMNPGGEGIPNPGMMGSMKPGMANPGMMGSMKPGMANPGTMGSMKPGMANPRMMSGSMGGGMPVRIPGSESTPGSNASGDQKKPKKNIFRTDNMTYQLTAIYLDSAVINGQDVKIGDRVGKATLKEIGIFDVKLQEEGKENSQTVQMFTGEGGGPMGGGMQQPGGMPPGMNPGQPRNPSFTSLSGGMQPATQMSQQNNNRGNFRDRMQNMTQQERDQFRQRMQNASPQEREQMRNQFMRGR